MTVHIIVAMYNASSLISENIAVMRAQTYRDFRCVLVDDISTDDTAQRIREGIAGDDRFTLVVNTEKKFKARNIVDALALAAPADDDIIALVDGDDMLACDDALATVVDTYEKTGCWMTYGSFCDSQGRRDKYCQAYDPAIIRRNSFRKHRWVASHLKTFKYALWKHLDMDVFHISEAEYRQALRRALLHLNFRRWNHFRKIAREDLLDPSGRYIRRIDDKAFSYPMLEMAGDRAVFIEKVLYRFASARLEGEVEQNYGKGRSEKWGTRLIRDILVHRPRYERLKAL